MRDTHFHFFELVYEVVRCIPPGRVTSYVAIARYLRVGSARTVGWAMNQSHFADPPVPAQRVVNAKGELSGRHHFGTATRMQELLEAEGITIQNDKVVDFDRVFWDPFELELPAEG